MIESSIDSDVKSRERMEKMEIFVEVFPALHLPEVSFESEVAVYSEDESKGRIA
jgi:hypothetical protein